jgi:hypothetical protein
MRVEEELSRLWKFFIYFIKRHLNPGNKENPFYSGKIIKDSIY